ncbi:helix-turn-helix transcriptional regulator [Pedobacter aquatilis]|uniref:helix-turn-helix domain-containing protein n=1 Tax=Pedobacter aquatilis TaxID=351343 RepID=UPI0029319036|nr:helix-turn-helix transcriptional regulator [Pedobacter aquatilis]
MRIQDRNLYELIGKNIKYYRLSKELSQQSLANKCDKIDRAKISDIENAKEDFMFSTLLEICSGLDITFCDVTTDLGEEAYKLYIK